MRKFAHALAVLLAHVAVLVAAHGIAEHVGHEIVSLVWDEWLLTGAVHAIDVAWGP